MSIAAGLHVSRLPVRSWAQQWPMSERAAAFQPGAQIVAGFELCTSTTDRNRYNPLNVAWNCLSACGFILDAYCHVPAGVGNAVTMRVLLAHANVGIAGLVEDVNAAGSYPTALPIVVGPGITGRIQGYRVPADFVVVRWDNTGANPIVFDWFAAIRDR